MKRFLICALTLSASVLLAQKPVAGPLRNAIGMDFVKIAPGEFMMGCSKDDKECNPDENPRHRIQITKGFEIGKYEVTQAQWVAIMQTNPSSNKSDTRPVETVSKLEAQDFISKLNAMNDGYQYRLPTEAEWEFAARAGTDSPYSGPLEQVAWYAANSEDETHPVGLKSPNAWGLYDTQGNVREWVSDLYTANYYSNSPAVDPTGPEPGARGGRGGGTGGGPGPGAPGGRGGRGGPAGLQGGNAPPPFPQGPPPGATEQQQIDALRLQVQQLQQEVQFLRNQIEAGPPRGGPGGPGRGGAIGPNGVPIDPIDGLPTGLPVVRGGGWDQSGAFQRVSARYSYYGPTLRVSDIGFRVVRQPVAQ
jgi:formylglycine-generating enzyme required for sulfatase activity